MHPDPSYSLDGRYGPPSTAGSGSSSSATSAGQSPQLGAGEGPLTRAAKKQQAVLRPRSNSNALSINSRSANAGPSTSSTSSLYAPTSLSQRPTHPYPDPTTPTFSNAFPTPPHSSPSTPFWKDFATSRRGSKEEVGLGLSTAKEGGVGGWLKAAGKQGTTVWLTPGVKEKRRVSDGILSPQADEFNERFGPSSRRSSWTRTLRSARETPLGRLVVLLAGLAFVIWSLLHFFPSSSPAPRMHSKHHVKNPAFRQTYAAPSVASPRIHPPVSAGQGLPAGAALAGVGKGWEWKDAREELGSLLRYVTSSGNAALPDLNTDQPLDPQLILDFNPYAHSSGSRSGRKMVEQMVDDFFNGKDSLGGGKVMIIGKPSDPAAMSIRSILDELDIDTTNIFVSIEGRSDTYQLHRLLERIINVPRLPALVIGGHPIGSYLQIMSLEYSGELYEKLDQAGVKYYREIEDDDYDDDSLDGIEKDDEEEADEFDQMYDIGEQDRPW